MIFFGWGKRGEHHRRTPLLRLTIKICSLLKMSLGDLVLGEGLPPIGVGPGAGVEVVGLVGVVGVADEVGEVVAAFVKVGLALVEVDGLEVDVLPKVVVVVDVDVEVEVGVALEDVVSEGFAAEVGSVQGGGAAEGAVEEVVCVAVEEVDVVAAALVSSSVCVETDLCVTAPAFCEVV